MVAKHLINETDTLVVEGLRGLLRANPELSLIEHERGTMAFGVQEVIVSCSEKAYV